MYSVVLMMAMSGGGDVPDFGWRRCHGCHGRCHGASGCHGASNCCGSTGATPPPPLPGKKMERIPAPEKVEAKLVVTLPADAKLTFNGQPTRATSQTRWFVTPPLEAGRNYHYVLKAEIVRDGQTQVVTQKVQVRSGEETRVALDFPAAAVAKAP
jgi:uncharacterized protein (TIGR03000 family)